MNAGDQHHHNETERVDREEAKVREKKKHEEAKGEK